MKINYRPFKGEEDPRAMEVFARQFRAKNLHVTDLPWRLSSWALDDPDNTCLWTDDNGHILAWAILQSPWWTLDYVLQPRAEQEIHSLVLAWAEKRARELVETIYGRSSWFVNVFPDQVERCADLEAAGFTCQADMGEDSWLKVLLERPGDLPVNEYRIPEGFVVRPLAGEGEAEAYVKLHQDTFETKNMTDEWRRRTLQHPDYVSDLDLVVIAPNGRLAAFCICWLDKHSPEPVGQIEPLGCHPDYRRYALGRIALVEGLRRLQHHGAKRVYVETDNYLNTAFRLYKSVGFRVVREVRVYRKDYRK